MSTCVFLFGGFKATLTDMNLWVGSAKAQREDVQFAAYPWPSSATDSDDTSAITGFKTSGQFDKAVKAVQNSGAELIYLVGHSSGCAIANEVDRALKDTSKIALVALDGFAPSGSQRARPNTQVWGATCEGVTSRNHDRLKKIVGARLSVYEATDCKTGWALHFSLVNRAASDSTVTSIKTGYTNCRANLCWL